MQTKFLLKKGFAVGIIVLLGICNSPILSSLSIEKHSITKDSTEKPHSLMVVDSRFIHITLNGTMGLNGWYISNVIIVIDWMDGVGGHIFYSFDDNTWTEYIAPVIISTDGIYFLYAYYEYPDGTNSSTYGPFAFKIDKTPPTFNWTITHNFWKTVWRITVNASDATSGVGKVEFYIDDILVGNVTAYPYTFIITIIGKGHVPQVIIYDNAGNLNSSKITPCIQQQNTPSIQQKIMLFRNLIYNLIMQLQMKIKHSLD
jgi:hypothetical protein